MSELHVVLGAGGAIGKALTAELLAQNKTVRAVERTKKIDNLDTRLADLLDAKAMLAACEGASHIYVCVGLPYRSEVWEKDWPTIMSHVISTANTLHAKVVFFDNVYMYGPSPLPDQFDENTVQQPITRKGKARKATADLFMNAVTSGKIQGLIARSADFYGPDAVNSVFYIRFIENMLKGKSPQFLGKKGMKHTFAYTKDNARAMLRLAMDESSYGQVWHLPVGQPMTVDEANDIINGILGTKYSVSYMPVPMRRILSVFMGPVKEVSEMLYQFDQPYTMSWDKFKSKYPDFEPTPYTIGMKEMITSMKETKATSNL